MMHILYLPFDSSLQKSQNKPSIFQVKESGERGDKNLKKNHYINIQTEMVILNEYFANNWLEPLD